MSTKKFRNSPLAFFVKKITKDFFSLLQKTTLCSLSCLPRFILFSFRRARPKFLFLLRGTLATKRERKKASLFRITSTALLSEAECLEQFPTSSKYKFLIRNILRNLKHSSRKKKTSLKLYLKFRSCQSADGGKSADESFLHSIRLVLILMLFCITLKSSFYLFCFSIIVA